jgi:uncharacterized protein (DUF1330 family)
MVGDSTRYVALFGLHVKDDALYSRYRAAMTPLLHRFGGAFGYDFVVSAVLKSETPAPINRVFTIAFADEAASQRFFSDPPYLAIRKELFEPSVGSVTKLGSFAEVRNGS